ncbi:MAG TPA: hypothetical protein VG034_15645 [Acidimicrobiia bacterium]|jgi:photosystem II stability/assembly factor-like uncharacterized protein|nr:hypothetical protein [Acidimicrobiia bacterium]
MSFVDRQQGFGLVDLRLVRTDDGGRTWRVVGSPIPTDDLGYIPGKAIFTSLSDGYIYDRGLRVTHDGGATWHDPHLNRYVDERDGPTDGHVLALQPRGDSVWALVACPPDSPCDIELHVSDDGGRTWRKRSTPMIRDVAGVSASLARVSATKAYAVAAVGLEADTSENAPYHHIAATEDGGRTWRYLPDPCHVTVLEFLAATGQKDLWLVCGDQGATIMEAKEVFRSSDGGEHWTLRSSTIMGGHAVGSLPDSGHVYSLVAVSPSRAYLGLGRATQFQTVDGGRTWTASFWYNGDVGGGPVNFVDPTHGWGTGEFHLYQTVDGLHWRDLGGGHP